MTPSSCTSTGAGRARMVLVTLEDLAGVAGRPNMPGTVDQWPNWRVPLPAPVDELLGSPVTQVALSVLRALRPPT